MGFMDSYKRLEKLCGDILDNKRCISAYIDEMISIPQGAYYVFGWNDDLKQLKHYRWIRNQIAHDPSCTEENMCSFADTQWISDFYTRIINQTDPLSLYNHAIQVRRKTIPQKVKTQAPQVQQQGEGSNCDATRSTSGGRMRFWIVFLVVFDIVAAAVLWLLLNK